jgi:probable HAF family extracellular repeat protein
MSANGLITYGYTWSESTGPVLLPLPPAGYQPFVKPAGINSAGTVVGSIYTPLGSSRAFVYDAAHGVRDLNTLTTPAPGFTMLAATAINDNGWIVGYGAGGGGMYRSFVLRPAVVGDLDGDGTVGGLDLAMLLGAWGLPGAADLDGSGAVGAADLSLLLAAWTG